MPPPEHSMDVQVRDRVIILPLVPVTDQGAHSPQVPYSVMVKFKSGLTC